MKRVIMGISSLGFILPNFAFALTGVLPDPCDRVYSSFDPGCIQLRTGNDFIGLLLNILAFFRNIFWIIVVVMILISAWRFLRSDGEPAKTEIARKTLTWTVVAIIVALVATSIPFVVSSVLGR